MKKIINIPDDIVEDLQLDTLKNKKGLEIPRYRPYAGTEIGKSIPILNF